MTERNLHPLSLTQYFDAPEGYRGVFGWICGYSADAFFLNDAAERFTRETAGQRAAQGEIKLALMLDPGQPPLTLVDVPGLIHLPILNASRQPFRLMHAKVALLGFRDIAGGGRWMLRLIVSTGNWTRQTLEESLDLVWCIEVDSEAMEDDREDQDLELRCADICAAWSLLGFLHGLFDLRVLGAGATRIAGGSQTAIQQLAGWLLLCSLRAGASSRFLDSRHASLLAQLPLAIRTHAGDTKRNYLAMGSGFFEGPSLGGEPAVPPVLERIVSNLIREELLVRAPSVDIFVNPAACQAVASALPAIQQREGWHVRKAAPMEHLFRSEHRSLHAKFLFGSRAREGSNNCLKPWVYLGSGNLTGPGFTSAMSRQGGNLEVGIVFAPEGLTWYPDRDGDPGTLITYRLPIQWETQMISVGELLPGGAMPPAAPPFVAPPIAWLEWEAVDDGGWLNSPSSFPVSWEVLNASGIPCHQDLKGFIWEGSQPRQVHIRWSDDALGVQSRIVPVMDVFGRLAATPLTALDFEEAWWALAGFPVAASETDDGVDNDPESLKPGTSNGGAKGGVGAYPVRQMMELIERVAERQTEVVQADWPAWCTRLEQTLSRVVNSPVLDYFRTLGLNPLSPLRGNAFRPDYAEDGKTVEGRVYETVLAQIEAHWQTAGLAEIGDRE